MKGRECLRNLYTIEIHHIRRYILITSRSLIFPSIIFHCLLTIDISFLTAILHPENFNKCLEKNVNDFPYI